MKPKGQTMARGTSAFAVAHSMAALEGTVARVPRTGSQEQSKANLELMAELGRPELIGPLLRSCLGDRERMAVIASRSYRHVNHFDKIVLVDDGTGGYRLTLHLWNPPYTVKEVEDELIHDHRFSFWSTILTGTLKSQNFMPAENDGDGAIRLRQYRYSPEKLGAATQSNFYEFISEMDLVPTTLSVEQAGSAYALEYVRIHRVLIPTEEMVCTLVLRGPRERNFSNVYNTVYPDTDTMVGNVMFSPEELAVKLELLLAAVERRTSGAGRAD